MNLLKKRFLSESVIFQGLSFGHFRQPGPESSASQNGVSTSSLPPLIVDLLTYLKITQGPTCFLMGILEGVQWKTSQADYNGPKKQCSLTYSHMFQVRHNPTGGALTEEMKLIFIEACKTWAGMGKRVLGVVYLDFDPTMLTEGFHFSTDGDEPKLTPQESRLDEHDQPPEGN